MFDFLNPLAPVAPNPAQAPTPPAAPQQQWETYLQNPDVRAAMLSAGLAMMRPSWGGPGQAIVSGIGAGAETYGDREQQSRAIALQERAHQESQSDRAERQKDKDLDRSQALTIAEMNNKTRKELFNMRASGAGGPSRTANAAFQKVYDKEREAVTGVLADPQLTEGLDPQDVENLIMARAQRRWQEGAAVTGSGNLAGAGGPVPLGTEGSAPVVGPTKAGKTNSQTSGAVQPLPADNAAAITAWNSAASGTLFKTPDGRTVRKP